MARTFEVNQKHLDEAVWYMKEDRQREADELLQRAARMVVDREEVGAAARIFGVNQKHLGRAVWFMKENRQREGGAAVTGGCRQPPPGEAAAIRGSPITSDSRSG